jgi:hypothetical protein
LALRSQKLAEDGNAKKFGETLLVQQRESSRQLRCHILPLADMETTSHIRRLLALGAVWNVNLNDGSGAETLLSDAMC